MEGQLILDRYRPLSELGEGGFGTVVLAWDTRMQRRVAIKRLLLPLDASGNPHRPPGLAEARTAAMLNHPCIVTVLDFDTDEDEAFLVMEYVAGMSLGEVLEGPNGLLTLDELAAVIEDVSSALAFAHENGVLHLDIKPDNILLGADGRAKVADFGMSALSTLSGHDAAPGGTLGYMPAEQLTAGPIDARTDGWALAAVAYEALTGDNPFDDDTIEAAAQRAFDDAPPPSQHRGDITEPLDHVLLVELSPFPLERYPNVTAFADALLEHLGDPVAGQESLAGLVSEHQTDDSFDDEYGLAQVGLWDRIGGRVGPTVVRTVAAVQCGWLAWNGLTQFYLGPTPLYAGLALVALAGALAPSLGIVLGLGCTVAGLAASGGPAAAAALAVFGALWWWLIARHDSGAAILPLSAPMLGAARLGLAQPLLAGFMLPPLPAAVSGLLGGALAMLASAATLHAPPYTAISPEIALDPWRIEIAMTALYALLTSPATYVALAGWPLAAAAMSMGCARATRSGAALGTLGGTIALGGTALIAGRIAAAGAHPELAAGWTSLQLALPLGASLTLVMAVVALGAPLRAEED